jgi:endogenous inhibitor of DNA gyrase (YacG/DUF329 family)
MELVKCPVCAVTFDYNPAQPNKKYCGPKCRKKDLNARTGPRNAARDNQRKSHDVEFIAVDGEGVTRMGWVEVWDDELQQMVKVRRKVHDYVLLSVGDQSLHHDGDALRHDEIFEFLYAQKLEHPDATFVGFFLGYDFSQWLKSLPESRGNLLFHAEGIKRRMPRNPELKYPFPVISGQWEFDFLGLKRFKLRPHVKRDLWPVTIVHHRDGTMTEKKTHPYKWMYINDAGAFFQTALMAAINPKKWAPGTAIVTDEEMQILQEGKDNRAEAQFDPAMIRYNVLENNVLSRLMATVNKGFVADGIKLRSDQWYGPGQAAQAWMRLIGAPTGEQVREAVPAWAIDAARQSYYGGWFEVFVHGPIPGTTYSYDINSAYPFAIASLPCLLHGEWTQGTGRPGRLRKGHLRLVNATFTGDDTHIGTMPHRDMDGGISRPAHTAGWHWQHEIDAARKAGMIRKVEVSEWVEYRPCGCPPPLRAIAELYEGRLKVGKETPFGKSKKLVYNSSYGKMAQSIGMPKFSNSIYASLITARCRTMILEAIASHPDKTKAVAMVATDGIVFLSPHPTLDVHPEALGKWDHTTHENLSILMPGLYWDDSSRESIRQGQNLKLKSRGVSGKYLAPFVDDFDQQWSELHATLNEPGIELADPTMAPKVPVVVEFGVISPRLAVARDRWDTCGQVVWDDPRSISANPEGKRGYFYADGPLLRTSVREYVRDRQGKPMQRSEPYANLFGADPLDLPDQDDLDEMLTQDGTVTDIIRAVIPNGG